MFFEFADGGLMCLGLQGFGAGASEFTFGI